MFRFYNMEDPGDIHSLLSSLRNRVLVSFPDLNMSNSRIISSGWDNYVLLVDERIAFKFPRTNERAEALTKEIEITGLLASCPVRVPQYRYVSGSGEKIFGGYEYIRGKPLNSVSSLSGTMVTQFADLLNHLRKVSATAIEKNVLPGSDANVWRDRYRQIFRDLRDNYHSVLGDEVMVEIESLFRSFLSNSSSQFETPLIHGDLYRENVIVNPGKGRIEGVIDWGDSTLGDPAIDFAAIAVDFPAEEVMRILELYEGDVDRSFSDRMEFYWKIEPVYEIGHSKVLGNTERLGSALDILKQRLSSGLF